ncbi:MAG: cytochrome P450 [bacterium]|nr:cytochrome P450 [bacterium]
MQQSTPPAMPGLPIIGNMLEFYKDRSGLLRRGYEALGSVFSIRLGPKRVAVLIGSDYHQLFFGETDHKLSAQPVYQFLVPMLGEPVGTAADPEICSEHRLIFAELFKSEKMADHVQVMSQEVQTWLDTLGESGRFELVETFERVTKHIAGHAFMGHAFRHRMGDEFWQLFRDLCAAINPLLPPYLPLPSFIRRDRAKRKLHKMLGPLIAERRANPGSHKDFLQTLIEAKQTDGRPLKDITIISIVILLIFAGNQTTSNQASWALIQLLQNPNYLQSVLAEQKNVLSPGQQPTLGTLRQLQHISWALKETERLHPVPDILLRYNTKAYEAGEYHIPAGWLTLVSPPIAHQLPEIFQDPQCYDPLRFAPGREEDRQHPFALMGFGGGAHKCMGMNFALNTMTVTIAMLLQQYHLELLTPNPQPSPARMLATRPGACWIGYRRRATGDPVAPVHTPAIETCPHKRP